MIKKNVDPCQYGGLAGSSTTYALLTMLNYAYKQTDKSGTFVRILLCDFSKAFDLVDHGKLLEKLSSLGVPDYLIKWCASFLTQREQRVKIGENLSNSMSPNGGCPQGTLIGPVAFVCHINDLSIPDPTLTIKYVDDTTILYSSRDPEDATLQNAANKLSEWSSDNKMKLNAKKTKELVINFSKKIPPPNSITIDNTIIERVKNAKIL